LQLKKQGAGTAATTGRNKKAAFAVLLFRKKVFQPAARAARQPAARQ